MLSEKGFKHHMDVIEHETRMYLTYHSTLSLQAVQTSRNILLRNFIKQHNEIKRLQAKLRENGGIDT